MNADTDDSKHTAMPSILVYNSHILSRNRIVLRLWLLLAGRLSHCIGVETMKTSVRFRLLVVFLLLLTAAFLLAVLEDKCETYRPFSFIAASIPWFKTGREARRSVLVDAEVQDKIIVVPALEEENVSWVLEDLPE